MVMVPAAILAKPEVFRLCERRWHLSTRRLANGTVRPSDMSVTMSRTVSSSVK